MQDPPTVSVHPHTPTMPAHRGGLGPFAQQLAMFSLTPIITDLGSNVMVGLLPGLSLATWTKRTRSEQEKEKRSTLSLKGRHMIITLGRDGLRADAAPTAISRHAAALKPMMQTMMRMTPRLQGSFESASFQTSPTETCFQISPTEM